MSERPKVFLEWKDLSVYSEQKSKSGVAEVKQILFDVNGFANPGEFVAVMGGSGSGKTTLLTQLAGHRYLFHGKRSGEVLANGVNTENFRFTDYVGYVTQDDILLATITPNECLSFSANLRVHGSKDYKQMLVNSILKDLGLWECRDVVCGGGMLKGLSGGQRKRVSVGLELITDPAVLFLDEPTSGLDSYTAFSLIRMMTLQAKQGRTIMSTIHQPSSDIYKLFDRLLLVSQGHFCYYGNAQAATKYFEELGFAVPLDTNPADYYMKVIFIENRKNLTDKEQQTLDTLKNACKTQDNSSERIETIPPALAEKPMGRPVNWFMEVILLWRRAWKNVTRNPMTFKIRLLQAIVIMVYVDLLYAQPGWGDEDSDFIQTRNGLLMFELMGVFFPSMQGVILTFEVERALYMKEYRNNMYGCTSYFLAKNLCEFIPWCLWPIMIVVGVYFACHLYITVGAFFTHLWIIMLTAHGAISVGLLAGSAFRDTQTITASFSIFILLMLLYGSYFTNEDNLEPWTEWIQYLSPFKYAYEASAINEYDRDEDDLLECQEDQTCDPLGTLGFDTDDLWWPNIYPLMILVLGYRVLAGVVLKIRTVLTMGRN